MFNFQQRAQFTLIKQIRKQTTSEEMRKLLKMQDYKTKDFYFITK